jgi:hypothetical protein
MNRFWCGARGEWLVDRDGRVVVVHGSNVVQKNPPFVRTELGADAADCWRARD